jgi:hypothetical protein
MKKLLVLFASLTIFGCSKELGGEVTPINVPSTDRKSVV